MLLEDGQSRTEFSAGESFGTLRDPGIARALVLSAGGKRLTRDWHDLTQVVDSGVARLRFLTRYVRIGLVGRCMLSGRAGTSDVLLGTSRLRTASKISLCWSALRRGSGCVSGTGISDFSSWELGVKVFMDDTAGSKHNCSLGCI